MAALLSAILLCACAAKTEPATPDEGEQAAGVALACYKALYLENRPEAFLQGSAQAHSVNDAQRQQLLDLYRQHVRQTTNQHGGVKGIDFARAEPDPTLDVMQVFLKMTYIDGMQEEIVVPMVQADGEWQMK